MFIYDDLELYKNINCRASYYTIKLWEEHIEQEFISNLGIRKSMMISIYVDNNALFFTLTSEYKSIFAKNISIKIPHILSVLEDLSTTINMTVNNSETYDLAFHVCSYFVDMSNDKDEGCVEIDCYAFCNILSYEKFKSEFLMNLSKELQFAIQKNYLQKNINTDPACYYDAELELVNAYMKIFKKNFNDSIYDLLKLKKISNLDVEVLKNINDLIS
jgi:hypothetical protein